MGLLQMALGGALAASLVTLSAGSTAASFRRELSRPPSTSISLWGSFASAPEAAMSARARVAGATTADGRRASPHRVLLARCSEPLIDTASGGQAAARPQSAPSSAPALSRLSLDLDGAGQTERITVLADGRILFARSSGTLIGQLALQTPAAELGSVTLSGHAVHGQWLIEVRAARHGTAGSEALVASLRAGAPVALFDGEIGPTDDDGRRRRVLSFDADGFVVYQTDDAIRRCDGQPAELALRRFAFDSDGLAPAAPPLPSANGAPRVAAVREPRARPPLGIFRFESASPLGDDGEPQLARPAALDDGSAATAWLALGPESGRGQFATATTPITDAHVTAIAIEPALPALATDARLWRRPQSLLFSFSGGTAVEVRLPAPANDGVRVAGPYIVRLPAPVAATCVTVTLASSYGTGAGPTAIGDIGFYTDLDDASGIERLLARVAAGGRDGDAAAVTLRRIPARAVGPLEQALSRCDGMAWRRLVETLASFHDPSSAPALVAALRIAAMAPDTGSPVSRQLARALRAMPEAAAAPLAGLLADTSAPEPARVQAASLLADMPGGTVEPVVAVAGEGSTALRRAVRGALAARPSPADAALVLEAATRTLAGPAIDAARLADLCTALGELARRLPSLQPAAILLLAETAGREAAGFEPRARALLALGEILGAVTDRPSRAQGASFLTRFMEPARCADPILRRLAATALARLPESSATQALARSAGDDPDPGVRDAAVVGLGTRDDAEALRALERAAASDGWPFIRRDALDALAASCRDDRLDVVADSAADPDPSIRLAALDGLSSCADPRAIMPLLRLTADRSMSSSVRARAATLLARVGGPKTVGPIGDALSRVRAEALGGDEERVRVALALEAALGHTGAPSALAPLLDALADPALPPARAGAAIALGELCPLLPPAARATPARALAVTVRDADSTAAAAARSALRRCTEDR